MNLTIMLTFMLTFMLTIVTDFFTTVGDILTGLLELLVSATSGVIEIFYNTNGFTIYGIFLLFGLAMFFLFFAWRVIQWFIRR